jgi:hypothetical protein
MLNSPEMLLPIADYGCDCSFFNSVHYADDVYIRAFYGRYGDSVAVMMTACCMFFSASNEVEVVGRYAFEYFSGNNIIVWNDGSFYDLQSALRLGLITDDDVSQIAVSYKLAWGILDHVCELCGFDVRSGFCSRCENTMCAPGFLCVSWRFCGECDCCVHFEREQELIRCGGHYSSINSG